MTNNQTPFSKQDFALAHLLIDTARVNTEEVGDPVSAEELAVFAEGSAEATLGQLRTQQIIYQLSQNQDLYDSWLDLCQFHEALEEANAKAAPTVTTPISVPKSAGLAGIAAWIAGLLRQPAFAAILGAVVTAGLFMATDPKPSETPTLATTEGDQLPIKAQMDSVESIEKKETTSVSLADWYQCTADQGTPLLNICYSKTLELQHWLSVSKNGLVTAISPPVDAKRIISVTLNDPLLTIEYLQAEKAGLSVFEVITDNQLVELRPLFQDFSEIGGYFEEINVTPTTVNYGKVTSAGVKESKQYEYKDAN